jgi:hypothetical protein
MGLRKDDLIDLVDRIFEIDSFKSKMGDDKDICVLSFSTKNEGSAKDLENLLKKDIHLYLMLMLLTVSNVMVCIKYSLKLKEVKTLQIRYMK